MKTNALLIFTRNPELGKVKTRLAKTIGNENALKVYCDLLAHTLEVTQFIDCDKFVFYDTVIAQHDIWPNAVFQKRMQFGDDLGAKMRDAFQQLFNLGYKNCVIVGSDLFDLQSQHISEAFNSLGSNDVVIGPAEDGGYYLLGLKEIIPEIFSNKDWGNDSVLRDTLKDLSTYSTAMLETLNDIDTAEDLEKSSYYSSKNKRY